MANTKKKKSRVKKPVPRVQSPTSAPRRTIDRRWYLGIALVAVVIVAVLVAFSAFGSGDDSSSPDVQAGGTLPGAAEVQGLLAGIEQKGLTLGKPDAPVTLIEYADVQCPFCAQYSVQTFPDVVNRYVKSGKVKVVFHGVAFIGPDSLTGLQAVQAAGQQDKLWNMLEMLYLNQGQENSGWITDDVLEAAGRSVPGLDVDAMMSARSSSQVESQIEDAAQAAKNDGVNGTPTFVVGKTSGGPTKSFTTLTIDGIAAQVDPLLK
ncbi:MAG TPA: thioredoxin domain-containing protein [Gaiellaceae bacterium]|jgi:protein-disulfide isomerase